jgi:hypothetical protein
MPAGKTYTPIARTTLTSAASSVTFSNISSSYTDLILISSLGGSSTGQAIICRLNGDTGSNYSYTALKGNGTSASSERASSQGQSRISVGIGTSTSASDLIISTHFLNYSNTTTNKTFISRANKAPSGDAGAEASVALWRSTAAITSILVAPTSGDFVSGSTFTLYGILAA